MKWRPADTYSVRAESFPAHQQFGTAARCEARLWTQYSLAGMFPMHVPGYIPDTTVSLYLQKCAAENALPWEIPDGFLKWE